MLPGETNVSEVALLQPMVLWCSAGNVGALGVGEELVMALGKRAEIRLVDTRPDLQALDASGESLAMLLYLNKDTWEGPQGDVLEKDVWDARGGAPEERGRRNHGIPIVIVHENDPAKGGCKRPAPRSSLPSTPAKDEGHPPLPFPLFPATQTLPPHPTPGDFGIFFESTPSELLSDGIYRSACRLALASRSTTRDAMFTCDSPPDVAVRSPSHCIHCRTAPSALRSWLNLWAPPSSKVLVWTTLRENLGAFQGRRPYEY